jgi:hypothetical protein
MKVLVCGGRKFADDKKLYETLDWYNVLYGPFSSVIHGAANGADSLAGLWAAENNISVTSYKADWEADGVQAGMLRNGLMLHEENPDLVIAFEGGPGTKDMVRRAKLKRLKVIEL